MNSEYLDDMEVDEGYEEEYEDDDGGGSGNRTPPLRLILLILFVLLLTCLVGILVYNVFFGDEGEVGQATATPIPSPTGVDVIVTPDEPTATPTRVLDESTPEPTDTPTTVPTEEPELSPTPTQAASPDEFDPDLIVKPGAVADLVDNGDFETFSDGIGENWSSFQTDGVVAVFSPEGPNGPYVKSGDYAQRITMVQASQSDRYAGIYQNLDVVARQPYSLTLYGQIRTGFADVNQSSYGYRVQYAMDHSGSDNWQEIPAEDWVEVPWDEQKIHSPDVEFLSYSTTITPAANSITLFVRAWKKWADPGEVHYTLDSISLVGPSAVGGQDQDDQMIDQPLPVTGENDGGFVGSGPFWGAILILILLAVGAVYRSKWSY